MFKATLWATCWFAELLAGDKAATSSTLEIVQKDRVMPCGCAQDGISPPLTGLLCRGSWGEWGGRRTPVSTVRLRCMGMGYGGGAAHGTPEKSEGRGGWERQWKKSQARTVCLWTFLGTTWHEPPLLAAETLEGTTLAFFGMVGLLGVERLNQNWAICFRVEGAV